MTDQRIVEVRLYRLRKGTVDEFHRLVHEESIPMITRAGHDVIGYGKSLADADGYFLIRAYDSLEQRLADQDAFYSSDAWRSGPREAIIALIEEHSETVFALSVDSIDTMRTAFRSASASSQ